MEESLLTVQQVADALRVDDANVRRWIKHGVMEAVRLPRRGDRQRYRIRRETLDNILNQ